MNHRLVPLGGGLLARLNPTGGPNNAFLATDGGGSGTPQATDSGGSRSKSGIVIEALTRTQAAIVRDSDEEEQGTKAAKSAPTKLQPPKTVPVKARSGVPKGFDRYDSGVRIDFVKTRLLGTLTFDGGTVSIGPVRLYRVGRPSQAMLEDQARKVAGRATRREDRLPEIYVQMDDLWPFWRSITRIDPATAPRTHELLALALQFATSVVMQLKAEIDCRRPNEVLSRIVPIIDVPGHASLPSGHATSAFMLSGVLRRLIGLGEPPEEEELPAKLMRRLAFRVAYNREVAGVHFPIDSAAGRILGGTLAAFFHSMATGKADAFHDARFLADQLAVGHGQKIADATDDTDDAKLVKAVGKRSACRFGDATYYIANHDKCLAHMWDRARAELSGQGLVYA